MVAQKHLTDGYSTPLGWLSKSPVWNASNNPYFWSDVRTGSVAYELENWPANFTGFVFGKSADKIGKWTSSEERDFSFGVIDGKMVPMTFRYFTYMHNSSGVDDLDRHNAICDIKRASGLSMAPNYSTVIIIPGAHPPITKDWCKTFIIRNQFSLVRWEPIVT